MFNFTVTKFLLTILTQEFLLIRSSEGQNEPSENDNYKPSFFEEISRHRQGGIDVSRHSKERRKFSIIHSHEPTPSPRNYYTTSKSGLGSKKKVQSESSDSKPKLKVGIVLPRQIFQQRKYQTIIRSSLNEIAQEKCLYQSEDLETDSKNEAFRSK